MTELALVAAEERVCYFALWHFVNCEVRDCYPEPSDDPGTLMTFHALLDQTLSSQKEHVAHQGFVSRWMWVLAGDNPVICPYCGEEVSECFKPNIGKE
ncbi:hypothetical protein H671_4g12641 [Cricetulus griseus]|nr:hypothetical protein H671_4g12641 [Cricetulus griseus]